MKNFKLKSSIFILLVTLSSSSSSSINHDHVTEATSQDFITCLQSNSTNATFISNLIFTPANASFIPIWQASVNNLRFNKPSTPKPSFIVTPVHESQIRTALLCTKNHGYEIRIRCGGHDFEGLSYTADVPFVMIDMTNMRSIDVNVTNQTAWVQGGAVLGELYYTISQKANTLYFPAGICPTVGVSGFLSGGGYGNLMRKYGLGADNVLDVRFMNVKGDILDRKSMGEDLFWAIRGGGGSSFGIVLAWKLRLVRVPELVTVFVVNKTLEEGATEIFHKYQHVIPAIDNNLLSTLLFGGMPTSTPAEILMNRSATPKPNFKTKSDYVRTPISITGLNKIWRKMLQNDGSETVVMYPFGGKMNDYSETAIPYPHRAGVLYQVLKTVDLSDQASDKTRVSRRRIGWLQSFDKFLEPYVSKNPREAYMNYNDLDLGIGSDTYKEASAWGERYWKKDNFKKLIRIKAKVDPENFFRHPQSIPVF
ncbi:hypothetical protein E3N88_42425 [Mikania micrantha]|uniref:FAD-binding PCMH-type domain-containing protein n=1 Tax=Mikania micrantha TaxID=192012 RepID=A0A5N6LK27_9ASTR|nr:hypothetical protein E3N88_42425 [Mikania micrantha]